MKILFLGSALSNHTLRWVNALSEKGHDVQLVCRKDQYARSENITINSNVKVHYLKYGGGMGYYLNAGELRKVYREFKPDVVNAHYATGYGTLARVANVHPLIISFWGSDIYEYPEKNRINWMLLRRNLLCADAIASTSHAMANKIKEVYPGLEKPITVTPFGVNTDLFKPSCEEKPDRPIIGIVKYLNPIYDIPLLIKSFSLLKNETNLNPLLYIYGGGSLLKELQDLCVKLNVQEDVVFFGTIPNVEIPKAINQMDVFVNCSFRESFGVALIEAMACEVPVVATDTEGYREVIEDGETGIILKDREPSTMKDAMLQLLLNKDLAKKLGENGRKRVLNLYDWNRNVETMEELYKSVVK